MSSCCSKLMNSAFNFNVEFAHLDDARQRIVHEDVEPSPPPQQRFDESQRRLGSAAWQTPETYGMVRAAARQPFAVRCDDQGGDRANVTFQGALESAAWRAPEKHAAVRAAARQHAAVQAEGERQDSIQLDVAVT